ncbi:hypothetical protein EDB19DRAFT_1915712 [Suillus lakei]|nr:hypothetical protein EDB19DRAFT_1915712 [Suillus lakei]
MEAGMEVVDAGFVSMDPARYAELRTIMGSQASFRSKEQAAVVKAYSPVETQSSLGLRETGGGKSLVFMAAAAANPEDSKMFLWKILNASKIKAVVLGNLFPMPALLIEELVINTYPMAWWTQAFDTINYNKFTGNLPNINEIREMVDSHFAQLPEGWLLVTPATYVDVRSTPVTQQLATIHASVKQEGEHIFELLENKVVEAQLVMASLLRMETALGQDVCAAIAATEQLVRYLKREDEFS